MTPPTVGSRAFSNYLKTPGGWGAIRKTESGMGRAGQTTLAWGARKTVSEGLERLPGISCSNVFRSCRGVLRGT